MSVPISADPLAELLGWLRPAFHADAACREHPELSWFPERGESVVEQRRVCAGCLVSVECRQAGEAEAFGLWGGASGRDRKTARAGGGHHVGPTRKTAERIEAIRSMRAGGASDGQITARLGISRDVLETIDRRYGPTAA